MKASEVAGTRRTPTARGQTFAKRNVNSFGSNKKRLAENIKQDLEVKFFVGFLKFSCFFDMKLLCLHALNRFIQVFESCAKFGR